MRIDDLSHMPYRDAWAVQEAAHAEVLGGGAERILFVEHPPVITYGRRPGGERNMLAAPEALARLGVEVVQSDRGGDITFHGPGQIVAYPIIRLNDHGLSVGGYVRALEQAIVATLAECGVAAAARDEGAVGVWCTGKLSDADASDDARGDAASASGVPASGCKPGSAKICAIGVRIKRGVSLHGLALNVATDLSYFNLIVPCGLTGRPVTSMQAVLGPAAPPIATVREILGRQLVASIERHVGIVAA